jgi:tetratricopeptide (TPR) repeat protein
MRRLLHLAVGAGIAAVASVANASWYEAKSKHFVIYANESAASLETFATKLEKFDKAVRIVRAMDDPQIGDGGRVTIFVLKDTDTVSKMAVGKESPIAGFYIPRASGSVAFVPRRTAGTEEWDMNADTVFFHEYAHHLMLQNTDAALPPWLVEGFAEFFSSAEFAKDGSVHLGMPAKHRAAGLFLLDKPKIEDLLTKSVKDDGSGEDFERFYGRAWLLTHYLTFEQSRAGQLAKYVTEVRSGIDLLKAAQDAFGDLGTLDRELDHYLRNNRFKYINVAAPGLNDVAVALRPLRVGEAAIMPIRVRSARGVDAKTAPEVAGLARAVAASYPDDPAVERELAEAEFDEHDYAASEKAADRALAADPKLAKALIYKGRAEMQLAESKPKADWDAIRRNFLAANKLDTEDPEPLLLYYESFGRSGERPTANAISGLEYAMILAPQDGSLRMMVVSELINARRFDEAREALEPLAYDPHSSKSREMARKIMDALSSKDPAAALTALNEATH